MKILIACAVLAGFYGIQVSAEDGVLTGDPRMACEAIMCLASGTKPTECSSSLSRYFSISFSNWRDTIQGRVDFLNMCPGANQTAEMGSLVSAIGNAVGRCDPQSLNSTMKYQSGMCGRNPILFIRDQLPDYCAAYSGHQYTRLGDEAPRYVGVPENGGFWSDVGHYDAALADYDARTGAWNTASQCQYGNGGYSNYWWQ